MMLNAPFYIVKMLWCAVCMSAVDFSVVTLQRESAGNRIEKNLSSVLGILINSRIFVDK